MENQDESCKCSILMNEIKDNMTEETIQILNECNHYTHYCICYVNQLPFNVCRAFQHACSCDTHSNFITCYAQEDNHDCVCWSLTSKKPCIAKKHDCGCCGKYWIKNQSKATAYLFCRAETHVCDYAKIGYDVKHHCISHFYRQINTLDTITHLSQFYIPKELLGQVMEFM
jgi:hypothetical protein